ncbi:unnamed protein product [Enterobius vermicularis]|uniref:MmcQ/YjbR family DNA-binding protein n=1 Tax=Enterobius vermicularis TaxID=51028 RepID=A0A0N4UYJ8_ENTVE|nr:unnamed protein product [Enterobius vermicularis]
MSYIPKDFHEDVTQFHSIDKKPKRNAVHWGPEELLNQPGIYVVTQIQGHFVILILDLNDKQTYKNYTTFRVLMQFNRLADDDCAIRDIVQVSALRRVIMKGNYKPISYLPHIDFYAGNKYG